MKFDLQYRIEFNGMLKNHQRRRNKTNVWAHMFVAVHIEANILAQWTSSVHSTIRAVQCDVRGFTTSIETFNALHHLECFFFSTKFPN